MFGLQVSLEDRFENPHRRRHHDTILDPRDSERSGPPWLARFGYMDPPDSFRAIPFRPKFFRQFVQPPFLSVLLDVLERLSIDACCSTIGLAKTVGVIDHIGSIHLVVQRIKAVVGRSLRFGMQRLP